MCGQCRRVKMMTTQDLGGDMGAEVLKEVRCEWLGGTGDDDEIVRAVAEHGGRSTEWK
jgi:hypothetical protein